MLEVRNVTIEGVDLAGKTTLYTNIHRNSKFRWNVQDRSHLSMLCYARQFNRGDHVVKRWRREMWACLMDLNNRVIVLLPDLDVLRARLKKRGDEFQTLESLEMLHRIFTEEVLLLEDLPNVLVLRGVGKKNDAALKCVKWLEMCELTSPLGVAREVRELVTATHNMEAPGCRFQYRLDPTSLSVPDPSVLRYRPEESYYAKILSRVIKNIEDELSGRNPYGRKEDIYATRRFIYTQDSCISLIHTMVRGNQVKMRVYCRSSDVKETFSHDFQFICYLYSRIYDHLASRCGWSYPARGDFVIDVELGSAHIPKH